MEIYNGLNDEGKRTLRNVLVHSEIATLSDKTRNIMLNYKKYELLVENILNNSSLSNGRYVNCERCGDNNLCFDLLVKDTIDNKNIAIQVKSINYDNNFVKIYEMGGITNILNNVTGEKEVLQEIINYYNSRYFEEKKKYGFDELQSIMLIKTVETLLIYQNNIHLVEFDTDLTKYNIIKYIPNELIIFNWNNKTYKFGFNNHTLMIQHKKREDYIAYITKSNLETISEKIKKIIDEVISTGIDSKEEMPFEVKFRVFRKNRSELAKIMTTNGSAIYSTNEIKRIDKSNIMYVNNSSGIYVLANSIIKDTSKMYQELLNLKAISPKGRILKDIRVKNVKDIKTFFN